ncbi:MAG: hypothetical protein IK089_06985, partial [Oxalobacter sp.]|nr:hypothetical protein [Oxalobacter sp.]
ETKQGQVSNNVITEITGNKVTLADNASASGSLYGGYSDRDAGEKFDNDSVHDNSVTVSNSTVGSAVYGGRGDSGAVKGNTVTISGSTVGTNVYGGYSKNNNADSNVVQIEKGSTVGNGSTWMAGGRSHNQGAEKNRFIIEDSEVKGLVYGGRSEDGENVDVKENIVEIKDGTVSGGVYGGFSASSGNVTSNRVKISGTNNTTIGESVYGGYSSSGLATGNTVELGNATINGSVYGGYSNNSESNVVTSNTLVLTGINNRVGSSVKNFETIKLADTLAWSDGATVLKASSFEKNADADGTRAGLDITGAQLNFASAASGQMTLLASETADDFKELSLTFYNEKVETDVKLGESNLSQVLSTGAESDSTDKGVTITSAVSHVVSLDEANSYRNVLYSVSDIASKVALGDMAWGTARDVSGEGFTFNADTVVDASNLTFTGTESGLLKKDDTKTLVKGAAGITDGHLTQPGEGKGTVTVAYTDTGSSIAYDATASGKVSVADNDVNYKVDSVVAGKITLGEMAWGTTADLPDPSWEASSATVIDAKDFAYTGKAETALTALKAGDTATATILNAKGLTAGNTVTDGTEKTVAVDHTDTNGINFTATASGHVAAAADKVDYVVDTVVLDKVNLDGWDGKGTSTVDDDWTGEAVAVETGSFAAPADLAAGSTRDIVTASKGFFTDGKISGANKYGKGET